MDTVDTVDKGVYCACMKKKKERKRKGKESYMGPWCFALSSVSSVSNVDRNLTAALSRETTSL